MKKFLACTAAVILAASMMTACGGSDTSSNNAPADNASAAATTTTAAAEESKAEETTTAAAEESKAEETTTAAAEESKAEESAAEGGDAAGAADEKIDFVPIADINKDGTLKNLENCSLKFNLDTDVNAFAEMFNEEVSEKKPGEEGYLGDEALLDLSVQDVGGVPMMKVNEILYYEDEYDFPYQTVKLRFDMNKLFKGHEEELEKIFTVKTDVVCIARDQANYGSDKESTDFGPVNVAWYGGAFGTNNNGDWNGNMVEYSLVSNASTPDEEHPDATQWTNQWAYTEIMVRPGIKGGTAQFNKDFETNYLTMMAWKVKSHIDLYVADIVFEDEDGNIIPVPEENIPGGAKYEQEDNSDILPDGILKYDGDKLVSYEGMELDHGDWLKK